MLRLARRSFTTRCAVDADALPLKPTWSVTSLLPDEHKATMPQKQLDHLCRLAQLRPRSDSALANDMNDLTHFIGTIQGGQIDIQPLIHIHDPKHSLDVRDDTPNTDIAGRTLLKNARNTQGYFYTVPSLSTPSAE
ncbi:hypothetical protein BC940DRAFT_289886 [Gongronella butleri]|nr:hypothetical protein BC940DRAFT_289886 [Gongronella butleri]